MPGDEWVVGSMLGGKPCVYPITILLKTQIVNDLVNEHPFLVVISPFSPPKESIAIYDAQLAGRRVTMAPTGYFQEGRPLLCDRGTASLWCEQGESLRAVAGKRRGDALARVAQPSPIAWKTWLAQNEQSRARDWSGSLAWCSGRIGTKAGAPTPPAPSPVENRAD